MSGAPLQCVIDDVAGLELRDARADGEHLADGRVAGVDLAAADVGDVHGVGERRVVDVVLAGDGEDAQVHVASGRPGAARRCRASRRARCRTASRSPPTRALLGGDRLGADREGSGHRRAPRVGRGDALARASIAGPAAPSTGLALLASGKGDTVRALTRSPAMRFYEYESKALFRAPRRCRSARAASRTRAAEARDAAAEIGGAGRAEEPGALGRPHEGGRRQLRRHARRGRAALRRDHRRSW